MEIVVAGAGYAGVLTAKKIEKKLRKKKIGGVNVTIIDKNPFHTMLTELHEVAAGRVEEDSIRISLKKVFAERNVAVVTDTIKTVDYEKRNVVCEGKTYPYDYLVLATGSQPIFFGTPGASDNAFTLWSYEDAVKLREHIFEMFRLAGRERDEAKKRELLTFVVVGCGFTGVEMAGDLSEFVKVLCRRFEIDRGLVRIIDMDMLERVCTVLPEKLAGKVQRRLEKNGAEVLLKTSTASVGKDFVELKNGDKTEKIPSRTVIWTAGVESSEVAKAASPVLGDAPRGRVRTDAYLRSINNDRVYIAGDNIFFTPEGETTAVPQMVENCEQCADVIAHNLFCDVTRNGEKEKYAPKFHGVMVSVGGRYAVAHGGLPGKFFGMPSFIAMFAKHFINILYFIQVLGWNKVFSYIRHEFFTMRDDRSFVGGHFSNKSPTFLLAPLRVYLGIYWVYEAIVKITEGWFQGAKLTGFYQGANSFYDNIMTGGAVSAASEAADAVSSASGETAAAAGELLFRFDILGLIRLIYVHATDYAIKIQVGFVDLIVNNLVLPNDTVQLVFQICIVMAELLVGLALIGGLFTTPAAAVSVVLQTLFLTSTGLYMASWWMLFASVACLFGAGRVLGLDYYAMPFLKNAWKKTKFARKNYLYHD